MNQNSQPQDIDVQTIPMQINRGVLIATVQVEFTNLVMAKFQDDLLHRIRSTGTKNVVIDLSGVPVMDSYEFHQIKKTMAMAKLMGADTVLVGLTAGVISSLVDLGIDFKGVDAAGNLEGAIQIFEERKL